MNVHDNIARALREGFTSNRRKPIQSQVMNRTYDCDSREHARKLVNDLLELQDTTHHASRVTCEGCRVELAVWTPNCGVTELDEEYVREADVIFEDARYWR